MSTHPSHPLMGTHLRCEVPDDCFLQKGLIYTVTEVMDVDKTILIEVDTCLGVLWSLSRFQPAD